MSRRGPPPSVEPRVLVRSRTKTWRSREVDSMDAQRAGNSVPGWQAEVAKLQPLNEMFDAQGRPRPECARVIAYLLAMESRRLGELGERAHRMFQTMGVTFNVYGNTEGEERIFPFDPIPRIISARVWGDREDGVIPRDLLVGSPQFRHAATGISSPCGVYITVAGIDLVRGADGRFHVLEDNVRTPSGVSYVIENRRIMTRLMPELIRGLRVRCVENYPAYLLASLRELAPHGVTDPTVALLTPGPFNSAFFEHVFISQQMGIELLEGRDLVCMDHKLFMKTVHGPRRIHVLYRRIDDDFLDPVVFRPDSALGVAGLTAAMRAGSVALANGIGTGVADDKAVFAYTPATIQYYLGEKPILPIVETYLLRDREAR